MLPISATLERNQSDSYDPYQGRRLHFYSKKDEIPLMPQGIWQVHKGLIQLSTFSEQGNDISLGWALPETCFGLWLSSLQMYKATALSKVYLRWFSISEIEASIRLSQLILPQLVRRMKQTEILLTIAGHRAVEERLQQLLLLLKQEMGQSVPEGTRIAIRLTHQNIANAVGATRVTITRLLGKMQEQGLIILDRDRHIILKDKSFINVAHW